MNIELHRRRLPVSRREGRGGAVSTLLQQPARPYAATIIRAYPGSLRAATVSGNRWMQCYAQIP